MTAQIGERLILDGQAVEMMFCPPLPAGHPRIIELDEETAQHDTEDTILFSTACWRGYRGTWEIRDGQLWLIDLRGRLRLQGETPLLADWFSGTLRVPRGALLHYVHMGFGSIFEEELHLRIEQGRVIDSRVIDNRGTPIDHWELVRRNLPGGEHRFAGDEA
ncbi:hypothetical protein [Kallotenue papyrolyticum]|uniref:hypothetical protein n=1 Tax=Kallotenue papyrolyticum TaxID=1325125 RepID=UPI00047853EB|nr:hypothetical protein [Kallotenue papyrolyticum]